MTRPRPLPFSALNAAVIVLALVLFSPKLYGQGEFKPDPAILSRTTLSGQWFLGYQYDATEETNAFLLKRGYFTLKTELSQSLSVRYTQDIIIDREGDDKGNVEMRLKYLYMLYRFNNTKALRNSFVEAGMVHRPWVEFLESQVPYRVQGTMFPERYGIINSADFGIMAGGLIGGMIDKEYQDKVSTTNPGKYGSFALGIYNGGGYHALEFNTNKTIEGRLTVRPMPAKLPGVQLSYGFAFGDGNNAQYKPQFSMNAFMLSTESRYHKANVLYTLGTGDFSGKFIDTLGVPYGNEGYSIFCEAKIPSTPLAIFARFDSFIINERNDLSRDAVIAGISYRFLKNKLVFDVEKHNYGGVPSTIYELVFEIAF